MKDRAKREDLTREQRWARTDRLLNRPDPAPFAGLPMYAGPNAGKVNALLTAARRVAKGAVDDGMLLASFVVDDWRAASHRKPRAA